LEEEESLGEGEGGKTGNNFISSLSEVEKLLVSIIDLSTNRLWFYSTFHL